MPRLIKNRTVVDDRWTLLRDASTLADVSVDFAIVPLPLWLEHRADLTARGNVGVWLGPTANPSVIAEDVDGLPLIAVDFPKFTDGRGYSIGRLLRDRYGFKGELRAIGDILRDQLFALSECGFDAFAIRADRDPVDALASFDVISSVYAPTSRTPQPWFRRRTSVAPTSGTHAELERKVADVVALLREVASRHSPAVFATGFGAEGMVLIDLIARHHLPIEIFTLDTGRLPQETHELIDRVRKRYGLSIDVFTPDAQALQSFVRASGVNSFYESIEQRKACCAVRKTEPLSRALAGKGAWLTGLRREQSVTRYGLSIEEFDTDHALPKFNPLVEWSGDDVWAYIRLHAVPYNALHDRGYPSIGCEPCTRAVQPGEDERSGRWWWEAPEHRECGIHRHRVVPISRAPSKSAAAASA